MVDSNSITACATIVLVLITGVYAYTTHKILEQSRGQQKIEYIQKKLELFYYPLKLSMYHHYEDALCYWYQYVRIEIENPENTPWDDDKMLEDILINMKNDFENYYIYSYLASDKLNDKLKELQDSLYDEGDMVSSNFEQRRCIYSDPENKFFKLCYDIKNMVDADITEYKHKLDDICK